VGAMGNEMPTEMGPENPCKEQQEQSTWNPAVKTLCLVFNALSHWVASIF